MKSSDLRIVGFSQIFDYTLSFIITYFILFNFQTEFYGIWSHFIKFSGLAIVLFSLELNSSFVNKLSGIDIKKRIDLIGIYILVNLFIFLPLILASFYYKDILSIIIFNDLGIKSSFLFPIIIIFILLNCLFQITEAFYITEFKFLPVSVMIMTKQVIKILSLYFAYLFNLDIYYTITAYCLLDFVLLTIFVYYSIRKYSIRIFGSKINQQFLELISFSKYIFITSILVSFYLFIDNIFIINFLNIEALAKYSLYSAITASMLIVTNITNKIITPFISKSFNNLSLVRSKYYLSQNINLSLYILVPISFGLYVVGNDAISLISSNKISNDINLLAQIIIFYFLFSIFIIYRQYFSSINKPTFFLFLLFIAVITNFIVLFIYKPDRLIEIFYIKNITLGLLIFVLILNSRINLSIIYNVFYSILVSFVFVYCISNLNFLININNIIIKLSLVISIGALIFIFFDLLRKKPIIIYYFFGKKYLFLNLIEACKNIYLRLLKKINYRYFNYRQEHISSQIVNVDDYIKNEYQEYRKNISNIINTESPNVILDFGCASGLQMIHYKKNYFENIKTKVYFVDLIIDRYKNYIKGLISHNKVNIDPIFKNNLDNISNDVDVINCDAVLTYLNNKNLFKTLDKFKSLNPKLIIIHDFNFKTFGEKIISFFSSEKSTRNLEKILKLNLSKYTLEKKRSIKKEFYYKKFGFLYILRKHD